MRHFQKIAEGVDVIPILNALAVRPDLWNENDLRTTFPDSPHAEVDDIWCMFDDPTGDVVNSIQTHPYSAWHEIPVKGLVLDLMRRVGGTQLGRVIITRLPPGGTIPAHIDQGAPAEFYTRYHLALQSLPGAIMYAGNESVMMAMGELWLFDNTVLHSVANNSADDRIVLIMDVRVC